MEKFDQTVVRGEINEGKGRFAAFSITVDARKLFSEYGMDYIRRTAKILFAEAFVHDTGPEKMYERLKEVIGETCANAARNVAMAELCSLIDAGHEQFRERALQIVKEVIEGSDEE